MNSNRSPTMLEYYRSFGIVRGAVAGLFTFVPVWSNIAFPGAAYCFPPLGDMEVPARIGAVMFALLATYFAYFTGVKRPGNNHKRVASAIILASVCFFFYLGFYYRFVRIVDIPSRGTSVQVTVGYERTDFAQKNFNGETDWEILRERGVDQEQISRLWTVKSLLVSHLSLLFAYCLTIWSSVAALSWGVLDQANAIKTHT